MHRLFSAFAACSIAVAALSPAFAQSAGSATNTTSAGVQVIDMNAPSRKPKAGASPAAKPGPPKAPTSLPGAAALLHNALAYLGAPYRTGGSSPSGFDCSGFTQYAFATIGIRIPRTADKQFYSGRLIAGDPLPGDLVFFQTYQYGPSHVGIYLGGGQFVNSIGKNVHIDSFDSPYFRGRYLGARRYL
jgi:cell wall-associated NlpC family hydrolase